MTLGDWLLLVATVAFPIAVLILKGQIPERSGGYIHDFGKPGDHEARVIKGKWLTSKWEVRQKRIKKAVNYLLLAIPVLGLFRFALKIIWKL